MAQRSALGKVIAEALKTTKNPAEAGFPDVSKRSDQSLLAAD